MPLFNQTEFLEEFESERKANKALKKARMFDSRIMVEYEVAPYESPERIQARKELYEYLSNFGLHDPTILQTS